MSKQSIFSKISKSIDNLIDPSLLEESKISNFQADILIDYPSAGAEIKKLELAIDNLIASLNQGQIPVNLKKVTQVFDGLAITNRLSIDVHPSKFVDVYNDLPNILTGYAIDATLSDESYHQTASHLITFYRINRGTYWIFPTDRIGKPGAAWLVPNPLKDLQISRTKSLNFCFDVDSSSQNNANIIILLKPALVQILPTAERLSWKLVERGVITNGNRSNPTSSIDSTQLTNQIEMIRSITAKHERLQLMCGSMVDRLSKQEQVVTSLQVQLENTDQQNQEITSLKIELAKLKADYQSKQKQKNTPDLDFADQVRALIHQEIENLSRVAVQISPLIEVKTEPEVIDAKIIDLSEQQQPIDVNMSPFAKLYNSGTKNFLRSYLLNEAKLVQSDSSIIQLIEDRTGIYWIVPLNNGTNYLVPSLALTNQGKYLQGLARLFDGNNNSLNFTLLKPAIVTIVQASKPKQWELLQKGLLQ